MDKHEEIEKLEKQRMDYLEVSDNKTAGRIASKIKKIENEIGLENEIEKYKAFIQEKRMEKEFEDFCWRKFILDCVEGE